jgi:hypothetical protein
MHNYSPLQSQYFIEPPFAAMSHPDHREPFYSLFWLGRGVTRVDNLGCFISVLAWYGFQSEAAVYRCLWLGIIFRQPFPHCVLWDLVFVLLPLSTSFDMTFRCFFIWSCSKFHVNKHVEPRSRCALVRVCFQRRSWQAITAVSLLWYVSISLAHLATRIFAHSSRQNFSSLFKLDVSRWCTAIFKSPQILNWIEIWALTRPFQDI